MMQWARCDRALQACPAHWVNSWQAYQFHKENPAIDKQGSDELQFQQL